MRYYRITIRALFALVFIGGGISHFILGRAQPEGYAVFADTALIPWLSDVWLSFVMPNIGWLTIMLGIYQVACGLGLTTRRFVRIAVWGMLVFLVFITIVGYGFPTESFGEDLLKNRSITIVMAMLLLPLLASPPDDVEVVRSPSTRSRA